MSSDFAFWKAGNGEPGKIFDDLADGNTDALQGHSGVSRFRAALLSRWPGLVDVLEPSEYDLAEAPDDAVSDFLDAWPSLGAYLTAVADALEQGGTVGEWHPYLAEDETIW